MVLHLGVRGLYGTPTRIVGLSNGLSLVVVSGVPEDGTYVWVLWNTHGNPIGAV